MMGFLPFALTDMLTELRCVQTYLMISNCVQLYFSAADQSKREHVQSVSRTVVPLVSSRNKSDGAVTPEFS